MAGEASRKARLADLPHGQGQLPRGPSASVQPKIGNRELSLSIFFREGLAYDLLDGREPVINRQQPTFPQRSHALAHG